METIGACVVFLLLLMIPLLLVGTVLASVYHRTAPLRAQAAVESARQERARLPAGRRAGRWRVGRRTPAAVEGAGRTRGADPFGTGAVRGSRAARASRRTRVSDRAEAGSRSGR